MRNPSESIDVSLPNGNHPYGVSLWDETFECARTPAAIAQDIMRCCPRWTCTVVKLDQACPCDVACTCAGAPSRALRSSSRARTAAKWASAPPTPAQSPPLVVDPQQSLCIPSWCASVAATMMKPEHTAGVLVCEWGTVVGLFLQLPYKRSPLYILACIIDRPAGSCLTRVGTMHHAWQQVHPIAD